MNKNIARTETTLPDFRAQTNYETQPSYLPAPSNQNAGTTARDFSFTETHKQYLQEHLPSRGSSGTGSHYRSQPSLKFQQLLEVAANEAVRDRLSSGSHNCTGTSGYCHDDSSTKQRNFYDMGYSSMMTSSNREHCEHRECEHHKTDVFGLLSKKYDPNQVIIR